MEHKPDSPEALLASLEKGSIGPFYLFYGPDEFTMELVLSRLRDMLVPEPARDLNCRTFYCDDEPDRVVSKIMDSARAVPFLSDRRLVIVRRLERLSAERLEVVSSYLRSPNESTCMILISGRPDFRFGFYRELRSKGACVHFPELKEWQLVPWIQTRAEQLGLKITEETCRFLIQYVGTRLTDIHCELEKLFLRHGSSTVGEEEIRDLALHSKVFTVFELMDAFSERDLAKTLRILERYIEEESGARTWDLKLLGMFIRQVNLLIKAKELLRQGLSISQAAGCLKLLPFQAQKLEGQAARWSLQDLKGAVRILSEADDMLKSNSPKTLVMDYIVVSLCRRN